MLTPKYLQYWKYMEVRRGSLMVEVPANWSARSVIGVIRYDVPGDDIEITNYESYIVVWNVMHSRYRNILLDLLGKTGLLYREGRK